MKIETGFLNGRWVLAMLLAFIVVVGGFGGLLLGVGQETANSASYVVIDDFLRRAEDSKRNFIWTLGDSTAGKREFIQQDGRSCLHITGRVPSKKNWSCVGTKTDLPRNRKGLSAAAYDGIYLRAKGTVGAWTVGLWMESARGPVRLYQAPLDLKGQWQEIRIPFRRFRSLPVKKPLNSKELIRIGSMVKGRQKTVEIFLDEVGFYKEPKMHKKLTPEEERIIIRKGTELPFSGKYDDHYEKGIYTCKRCGAELYESSSKFKSGCGWPSFDEQIVGAVKWQPDADGVRTEIICAKCDAHLGHVFLGEGHTQKNIRHCVNSVSMDFVPDQEQTARAIFASGCFWGTEYHFQRAPGVLSTTVGYTGGHVDNPTYKQVCTDKTGHAEAVEVVYDPSKTNYEQLAKLFFETHTFTQLNRQGPDVGTQYRSAVFYLNEQQRQIATQLIQTLKKKDYDVKTQIVPADKFWPGEKYHQDYYEKTKKLPYCHIYRKIF